MDSLLTKAFFAALFISGIPLFSSGLPQPSDMIMAVIGLHFFINSDKEFIYNNYLLVTFVLYTLVINMIYTILLSDPSFLPSLFYYPFCLLIFVLGKNLEFNAKSLTYMRACYITLGFLLLVVNILFPTLSSRQTVLFNNPNQLGYWALSMIIIYFYLFKKIDAGNFNSAEVIIFLLFTYFVVASLSKAAIAALFLFYIMFALQNFKLKNFLSLLTLLLFAFYAFSKTGLYVYFIKRMENFAQENDSSLQSRGYYRIFDFPQYLYFGSGQGSYGRFFKLSEHIIEIHSSIGTILFSYGLIGLALFCLMIISMTTWKNFLIYLLPLFLYGLTHNGLKETNFWLLLGLFSNVKLKKHSFNTYINMVK